ncbi:hypothetical protein PCANB_002765 [Pneumocystis canis]|nr:hypothetical protein PCANB_002765 [Pneumocystis canis]
MKDLQETIEQAYKHSEQHQNDSCLKNKKESTEKSPIFVKKVPLNSIYSQITQHNSLIKTGSDSLNQENSKQRTLPPNLLDIMKKHDSSMTSFKHEDILKQDLIYNKPLSAKEKNNKKIPENNFEICIPEKTPSKFLNFNNRLHNSPLLQTNTSMESQLSISNKNPWRNRLSEFSPPAKRKKPVSESHENADCIIFADSESPFIDATDIFSNTIKKQKILQPNLNRANTPLVNINNISKDSTKPNQKKINSLDQNNGGVGLLFSGLEKIRREREELERELNIKNAELSRTNSELLSIKQKTKDIKSRFFGFQKYLDGLGRDHNSLHKEIIKWSNEIKSFQTDIIKSRESLQGIIHQCDVLTHQGKLNSKVHKQLGEVKEELVKQNMYAKSLQEKYSKDAVLLVEERNKVRFLENQLANERKEKDEQCNRFLKEQEVFEKLLQDFHEETQKSENTLKNMFSLWSNEVKTMEHRILHEISFNFQAGPNVFTPLLKEIQEKWGEYSKESLSIYSDIKNFHSSILSFKNKRIEDLEKELKQANTLIEEKGKHEYIKKMDDFAQLIKPLCLEIEDLKLQLENSKTDFKKSLYLKNHDTNNENCLRKSSNIKEICEVKITEKKHEHISDENIKLQNILKDIKQELKLSKDECDSLKSKLKNLENSNSLFIDSVNNIELKKQYEKEIAEHERRALKLKETEQAKFDNIIKSKDNKINKLEKEISALKSFSNDKINIKENDKIPSKEKLVSMIGQEKAELIEKITEQDNIINSLKFEMEKLLNTTGFLNNTNKDPPKTRIPQSTNRIIHQTPGKSDNISKITTATPTHLVSQIISPPSENKIKKLYSNSLEYLNNENSKLKSKLSKDIKDYLRVETITDNIDLLNNNPTSTFSNVSENIILSNTDELSMEKSNPSLILLNDNIDIQNEIITSTQSPLQSIISLEKEDKKNVRNHGTYKDYAKDEGIEAISLSECLSTNTYDLKNIKNGSLKKKQDKQKSFKKPSIECTNNDSNFWLNAEIDNSTEQKSYPTRSITNTYKRKMVY